MHEEHPELPPLREPPETLERVAGFRGYVHKTQTVSGAYEVVLRVNRADIPQAMRLAWFERMELYVDFAPVEYADDEDEELWEALTEKLGLRDE